MSVLVGAVVDIPPPWGDELQAHRLRFGDPLAAQVPPHLTVLPPARLPADRLGALTDHLAAVAARTPSYELRLAGADTFRPVTEVVFVRVAGGVAESQALAAGVRAFEALVPESPYGYHPHVTIAHDVPTPALDAAAAALADFRASFPVVDFTLCVRPDAPDAPDVCWHPYATFRLTG